MPDQPQPTEQTAAKTGGGKTILVVTIFLFAIAGAGAGGFFLFFGGEEPLPSPADPARVAAGLPFASVNLGDFIANMAPPDSEIYLRVALDLGFRAEKKDAQVLQSELDTRHSQLRDAVMMILSSKRRADVETAQGKQTLKEELTQAINKVLQVGKIETVFFQEFAFQRL